MVYLKKKPGHIYFKYLLLAAVIYTYDYLIARENIIAPDI